MGILGLGGEKRKAAAAPGSAEAGPLCGGRAGVSGARWGRGREVEAGWGGARNNFLWGRHRNQPGCCFGVCILVLKRSKAAGTCPPQLASSAAQRHGSPVGTRKCTLAQAIPDAPPQLASPASRLQPAAPSKQARPRELTTTGRATGPPKSGFELKKKKRQRVIFSQSQTWYPRPSLSISPMGDKGW